MRWVTSAVTEFVTGNERRGLLHEIKISQRSNRRSNFMLKGNVTSDVGEREGDYISCLSCQRGLLTSNFPSPPSNFMKATLLSFIGSLFSVS